MFHRWTVFEDIVVCSFAMARKTDPKAIKKIAKHLGIAENKVAYRLCNFTKLTQGKYASWHYSRQEKKVFNWLNLYPIQTIIKIYTI